MRSLQLLSSGLLALLLALLLAHPAHAQAPRASEGLGDQATRALTQYGYDTWDDRQGLPQNTVQAITQSTDGYLWIGTQDGVVRFDGARFTVYGRESSPALARPYIWSLASDPDGSVWIGTEEGGLIRHQQGRFTRFTEADGLPGKWVNALLVDRSGTLWIGMMGGGLAKKPRNGRIQPVDSMPGGADNPVFELVQDREGHVWAGTAAGLVQVDGARPVATTTEQGLPSNVVLSVAEARAGGLWVGTNHGVARLHQGRVVESFDKDDGMPAWSATGMHEDAQGNLWISTPGGLVRRSRGRLETVPKELLPGGLIGLLYADREGSLWIGAGNGLGRLRETPIVPLGVPEGLASDAPTAVLQDRTGAMWIGSLAAGVTRLHGGRVDTFNVANKSLPANIVFSLAEDRSGAILVGTGNGMVRIRNGVPGPPEYLFPQGEPQTVRAILEDRQGRLWVAGYQGVRRLSPGPVVAYDTTDGLPDNTVWTLLEDTDGTLWAGSSQGISRLMPNGRWQAYTQAHGMPDASVMVMRRGRDGSLWAGTSAGLARLKDGRIRTFTAADGLCDEVVMGLLEDDRGRLWVSAFRGVFAVPYADFDALQSGRSRALPCRLLGRAEGMRNRETQGAVNPSSWRVPDGRMWIPTLSGMVVIDPENAEPRLPQAPVVIEEIIADGRSLPAGVMKVPAGTRRLEIHYTATRFIAPEQLRFRYRLEGADGEWVDAGNQRTAYFTNLRPGRYTFRVDARDASGGWSQSGASITFEVGARWYQTGWARALAVLAALALLLGLYWLGLHTLQARARALARLVEERTLAEARFRDLFDNASDAVFTTDLEGRFTALNRKAQELTGYSLEEARGISLRQLLPHTEAGERTLREWLAGTSGAAKTVEIVARDGSRIPVEVSTRRVEEDGRPVGMQAVARDVRERVALEAQLRQSQKMDAVGRLAGGVAHDFNNLLTIIKGSGDLLLMDLPEGDPAREDVEQIAAAADRAAGLTRQLLAFSRKQVVQPRVLDLNRVVTGLEPMLRRLIGEDIAVACLPGPAAAPVLADPGQLEQVLVNLVVNARDAMPEGGTITIETSVVPVEDVAGAPVRSTTGRAAVLTVTDTGTGMDAATQARIFEPFFTTKEAGKGTGLGLSTVYGIVRQAEGTIQVVSAPGQGTSFRIYLPCAVEQAVDEEAGAGAPVAPGTETVLLVEDEDAVRGLAHRILRRQGYTVIEARHGGDALTVAETHRGPIHLLLTDLVMPQMGGRELATRMAQLRPGLAVLFTSGYTDDEVVRRGLLDAHQAFVEKPFTADSLARAVRTALDERASRGAERTAPAA